MTILPILKETLYCKKENPEKTNVKDGTRTVTVLDVNEAIIKELQIKIKCETARDGR